MKKNKVSFLWIIIILLIVVIISLLLTRDDDLSLAKKLCSNLMNANVLSEGDCVLSTSAPILFEKTFPSGTPEEVVMAGMEGFRISRNFQGSIKTCSDCRVISFQTKGWSVFWNEYINFSFCKGALIGQTYSN
ncbi:MAG: hypothetical protein ACOYKC_00215 [Anaerolineaceae bacterium]|jgi:hypothetical protein